jgi:hypothetical protein
MEMAICPIGIVGRVFDSLMGADDDVLAFVLLEFFFEPIAAFRFEVALNTGHFIR